MTKMSGGLVLAVAVAVGLAASPLQAQRGAGMRGQMAGPNMAGPNMAGPNMGLSLDILLENQENLDLTGDQLRELESLKATMDGQVAPLAEEMTVLREQIWAGEVDRSEGFRQLQALRGEFLTASAPLQGRVQEILTVEQHRLLQAEVWQNRPGMGRAGAAFQGRGGAFQGRGGAFQGRGGMGMTRGQLRGSRGGCVPRHGFNGQGRAPAFGFRQAAPRAPVRFRNDTVPNLRRGGGLEPQGEGNLYLPR